MVNISDLQAIARQDNNLLVEDIEGDKMVLYQIFTRLFANTKSVNKIYGTLEENGVSKFKDITDTALQAIQASGYNYIWCTGVIEHAVLTDYTSFGIELDDADVVKGRAGSPYAIKDYYDVNPDLAVNVPNRMREFESLVERIHQNKLKIIIDFVPNHVARKYYSDAKTNGSADFGTDDNTNLAFDPHNNFYYIPGEPFRVPPGYNSLGDHSFPTKDGKFEEVPAKATGNDQFTAQPDINDWFETAKLNYGVDILDNRQTYFDPIPDTWQKMKDILLYWAGKKADGFRCDMAEMVPVEFWHWVIGEVKAQYPEVVFIAEIYNPDQYRNYIDTGRFDYLYDKVQLYDTLKSVIQGAGTTDHLPGIWHFLRGKNKHMLRFLENHDEQRIASRFFAEDPWKAIPAMVVSALWHTGPIMVYAGQEFGEPALGESGFSGDDGRTTIFDYWGVPELQKWVNNGKFDGGQLSADQKALYKSYRKILQLCSEKAFNQGYFYDLHPHNRTHTKHYTDKAYGFLRFKDEQQFLIVTNFDHHDTLNFSLKIPKTAIAAMGLSESNTYQLKDVLFSATTKKFEANKVIINQGNYGIPLTIAPLASYVFEIQPLSDN